MSEYIKFAVETLVPAAQEILLQAFDAHKSGRNIDIQNKADGTPASNADRAAEQALRRLIKARYPDHGIIGEEEGGENTDAAYVWVLDPLDGTREFLAQQNGWGTLIALMHHGRPVAGIIHDSLNGVSWSGQAPSKPFTAGKNIDQASIACTAPGPMFAGTKWQRAGSRLFADVASVKERLNCLGFAYVADGSIDIACEAGLKLHDIAALLPVFWSVDAQCQDFEGRDYAEHIFNLQTFENDTYNLVSSRDPNLLQQTLDLLREAA